MWADTSFEAVRKFESAAAAAAGIADRQTAKNVTLSVMSHLGELCTAMIWKDTNEFSELEKLQVAEKLSDAIRAMIRLADIVGIDLGDAALKGSQKQLQRQAPQVMPEPLREPSPLLTPAPVPTPPLTRQEVPPPKNEDGGPEVFCPVFPPHDKTKTETVHRTVEKHESNGKEEKPAPVEKPDTKQRPKKLLPTSSATNLTSRRGLSRTLSVMTMKEKNNPSQVQKMFSPTHFEHGLFSPHTAETDFKIEYEKDAPLAQSAQSQSKTSKKDTAARPKPAKFALKAADSGSSNATHSTVWSIQPSPPVSPLTPATLNKEFMPMIEAAASLGDKEWMELELTYCMPLGGKIVELKEGCRDVIVKPEDKHELLRLARAKNQEWLAQQEGAPAPVTASPPQAAKKKPKRGITRTLSVRLPKATWDPQADIDLYSPTHFSKDLFSPTTAKTDFNFQPTDGPLPQAAQPLPQALITVPTDSSAPRTPGTAEQISTPQHLHDNFDSVIEGLESLAFTEDELNEMNIAFCVPYQGRVYDLIPNGQNTQVDLSRLPEFIALAKLKREKLAKSESGSA